MHNNTNVSCLFSNFDFWRENGQGHHAAPYRSGALKYQSKIRRTGRTFWVNCNLKNVDLAMRHDFFTQAIEEGVSRNAGSEILIYVQILPKCAILVILPNFGLKSTSSFLALPLL